MEINEKNESGSSEFAGTRLEKTVENVNIKFLEKFLIFSFHLVFLNFYRWQFQKIQLIYTNGKRPFANFSYKISKFSCLFRILGPGSKGGGFFFHWRNQNFRVFSNSKIFKKGLKKQWKIYVLKSLRKFCDFLKILSKFSQKFRENFRKFSKYGRVGGSGGGAPRT